MKTKIIALCGRARAGKDTVAKAVLAYRKSWETRSFAAPMKEIVAKVYGFSDYQLYGPSEARNAPDLRYPRGHGPWAPAIGGAVCACCGSKGPPWGECFLTPRFALQTLGTEWGRRCYPDTWAAMAVRDAVRDVQAFAGGVMFTDCRFVNEAEAIKEAGGEVWRIVRPDGSALSAGASAHVSEVETHSPSMDTLVDREIMNDGTIGDLEVAAQWSMMNAGL